MQNLIIQVVNYSLTWAYLIIFAGIITWLLLANLYKKRFILASILLGLVSLIIIYGTSAYSWLSGLGTDSFTESQDFNLTEASFFLETAGLILTPEETRKLAVLILFTLTTTCGLEILRRILHISTKHFYKFMGIIILISPVIMAVKFSVLFESNSATYKKLLSNFDNDFTIASSSNKNLQVVVYIGESLSAMHFGLYNYFRNTTPELSKISKTDSGLIKFNQAYAPHTHTTVSLLEDLSIGVNSFSQKLPITQQKRISIIDILNKANIYTEWISNQAPSGPGAYTATIIANNARKKVFSAGNKYASNIDSIKGKPTVFDHELLVPAVTQALKNNQPKAVFLHSYAGHGPYIKSVPKNQRKQIDAQLNAYSNQALFGKIHSSQLRSNLENYDTAIKYVTSNVSNIINQAKNNKNPTVVIFFSDHGESLFAGRGHDSSRYVYEMSKIPFIIYFNKPAQKTHVNIFSKLKENSKTSNPVIASQLPSLILDLFGIKISSKISIPKLGEPWGKKPVYFLVRNTINNTTYLQLNPKIKAGNNNQLVDSWRLQQNLNKTKICYHRSNSLGKIMRGTLALPCIEADIIIENNKVFITHPPAPKTNLDLNLLLKIANKKATTIWLDAKNIHEKNNCQTLLKKVTSPNPKYKLFVEFNEQTDLKNQQLLQCAKNLNNLPHVETAIYVPAKLAEACTKVNSKACSKLNAFLQTAISTKAFNNFSFSYPSTTGMGLAPNGKALKWNTWGMEAKDISPKDAQKFNLLITKSGQDPNQI